jgi:hypothetical protein
VTPDAGWHLDKRVPVALIIVLLTQLVGGVWVTSQLFSRVERLEAFAADNKGLLVDYAVVRARLDGIEQSLRRIEQAVGTRDDRRP